MDEWKVVFTRTYNNPLTESPPTWLYLALVFCPTCEEEGEDEGDSPLGTLRRHMKQLPCTKNQLQRPLAPRLAVSEGLAGGECDR